MDIDYVFSNYCFGTPDEKKDLKTNEVFRTLNENKSIKYINLKSLIP